MLDTLILLLTIGVAIWVLFLILNLLMYMLASLVIALVFIFKGLLYLYHTVKDFFNNLL